MQTKLKQHPRRGVTLVEVLVVVTIIGILAGVIWLAVAGSVKAAAKRTQLKSDLHQIILAANIYRADNDDGLPSNWKAIGYYGTNRKDKFSKGFPPQDVRYDKPPSYDVSYHTPECAAPPSATPSYLLFRQDVAAFNAIPRANVLDIEKSPAVQFSPACAWNTRGTRPVRIMRDGKVVTYQLSALRSLSIDYSGRLTYEPWPDWSQEIMLGR
jgi:prepilin-type N-terminal cleavage/methylation domain-containing protein